MIKYFEVEAKCGHVGRGQFFRGVFYRKAESAKSAAEMVRYAGRVKHDHKDAILCVREITKKEYNAGRAERDKNPYYRCSNVQEQRQNIDLIQDKIEQETKYERVDELERKERRNQRIKYKQMKYKAQNDIDIWEECSYAY